MGMPVSVSYTTTGAKTGISIDWMANPSDIGVAVVVPGGTTTSMTVEGTYDNINDPLVTADWITVTELGTVTATKDALVPRPYQFIRANIASISGGPIRLKMVQPTPAPR